MGDNTAGRLFVGMADRLVAVLRQHGGTARLETIYAEIERAGGAHGPRLQASIRRALVDHCDGGRKLFQRLGDGVWGLTEDPELLGVVAA